jgi:hypothetical protein
MTRSLFLSLALIASLTATATATAADMDARTPGNQSPVTPANQVFLPNAVITEGFESLTGTFPNQCVDGWTCINQSSPLGPTGWFEGDDTAFSAQAGSSYIAANRDNTQDDNGMGGTIDNWLITPQVNFGNGATLLFWSRTVKETLDSPDRLEIRLSTAGASTDPADFTTLLGTINPDLALGPGPCVPNASGNGGYPQAWCQYTLTHAQGIPTSGSGRIAFRYYVTDAGPTGENANYIGIDTFSFNEGVRPPQFAYAPAPGSTVTGTGGGLIGSTSNLTINVSIGTPGFGSGAAATTTLSCTAPTAPFAGFDQTVTAVGNGTISGGPLAGTCTRGPTAVTQTLTCTENQGGTPVTRTWTLNCPAGTIPAVPVNATSAWSLIALMLALFGLAAVMVRRQG